MFRNLMAVACVMAFAGLPAVAYAAAPEPIPISEQHVKAVPAIADVADLMCVEARTADPGGTTSYSPWKVINIYARTGTPIVQPAYRHIDPGRRGA